MASRAGLAGALLATLFASYLKEISPVSFLLHGWDHHRVFDYGVNLAIWTVAAQGLYLWFSVRSGHLYERLSWKLDLLDLRPLAAFEREGTTTALVGIVMISLMSLLLLDLIQRSIVVPIALLLLCLAFLAATVILPMRSVQRRRVWHRTSPSGATMWARQESRKPSGRCSSAGSGSLNSSPPDSISTRHSRHLPCF